MNLTQYPFTNLENLMNYSKDISKEISISILE